MFVCKFVTLQVFLQSVFFNLFPLFLCKFVCLQDNSTTSVWVVMKCLVSIKTVSNLGMIRAIFLILEQLFSYLTIDIIQTE